MSNHVTYEFLNDGLSPWWIAHDYPERPVDDWCVWSWDCDACMIHLVASASIDGDHVTETFAVHAIGTPTTVSETLAEARAWRAEQGMREL